MNARSNLLGHILRIIFEFVNNYGLSIVVFTLFVRLLLVPLMISNMAAGNVSIQLGLKGKCIDVVTACATGSNARHPT